MEHEFTSLQSFANYLLDEERSSYTVEEMLKLNTRLNIPQHQIKATLSVYGFTMELRSLPKRRVRGFATSSHDRWYGPGSEPTHGGS